MRKRLLTMIGLLTWGLALFASQTEGSDAAEKALASVEALIAQEQQMGNVDQEGQARWQKIVTLKNFSIAKTISGITSIAPGN